MKKGARWWWWEASHTQKSWHSAPRGTTPHLFEFLTAQVTTGTQGLQIYNNVQEFPFTLSPPDVELLAGNRHRVDVQSRWVSHEIRDTSAAPLVLREHTTERSGTLQANPTLMRRKKMKLQESGNFKANRHSNMNLQCLREGTSTSQHPYRQQANSPCPHPRRQHQVPRSAPRERQLQLGQ